MNYTDDLVFSSKIKQCTRQLHLSLLVSSGCRTNTLLFRTFLPSWSISPSGFQREFSIWCLFQCPWNYLPLSRDRRVRNSHESIPHVGPFQLSQQISDQTINVQLSRNVSRARGELLSKQLQRDSHERFFFISPASQSCSTSGAPSAFVNWSTGSAGPRWVLANWSTIILICPWDSATSGILRLCAGLRVKRGLP